MTRTWAVSLALIATLLVAAVVFFAFQKSGTDQTDILVLCGGSMRAAMEQIRRDYSAVSDDEILLTFGGSGELCAQIKNAQKGDIYVCHDPFMAWAEKQGLIEAWRPVARLEPVIVVPKGNPKGITGLKDLARPGLRLGVGDPKRSTCGVLTDEALRRAPYGHAIRKNVRLHAKSHQKIATDVADLKHLHVGVMWNAVAFLYRDKLETIPFPREYVDAVTSATYKASDLKNIKVTIGITRFARDNKRARKFWEYATTDGKAVFEKYGFSPAGE